MLRTTYVLRAAEVGTDSLIGSVRATLSSLMVQSRVTVTGHTCETERLGFPSPR